LWRIFSCHLFLDDGKRQSMLIFRHRTLSAA
jgi:hypothetical protein